MPTENEKSLIRLAEGRDAQTIAEFNIAMARETEDLELDPDVIAAGVRNLLQRPDLGFYVVAEQDGAIAASLMVTFEWSDWRNGLFWWIQSVYVRPEFRRQGRYRQLHEFVAARAREQQDVCGLRLYVEVDNLIAQQTYDALGMLSLSYRMFEQSLPREPHATGPDRR